jgi:hypothetical protein
MKNADKKPNCHRTQEIYFSGSHLSKDKAYYTASITEQDLSQNLCPVFGFRYNLLFWHLLIGFISIN